MQLQASLSRENVAVLVRKFVPFELELGEAGQGARSLAIDEVSDVTLVADAGVRIVCKAHVRWPVMGLPVPVRAKALALLLRPRIAIRDGTPLFIVAPTVEHAEIAWSPSLMDDSITERLNRELAEQHVELAWNFAKTLSHAFRLPGAIKTAATFGIEVVEGQVTVTEASLGMTVLFRATVDGRA